jgi:tryptophan halogenase
MKVLVAGGGTAGLIAATILKRKLNLQVDIVRSKDIGTIGVGEGSTEHFGEYAKTIGLDFYNLIKYTNATLKMGIAFDGWNPDRPYMHSIGAEFDVQNGQYNLVFGKQVADNSHYMVSPEVWDNVLNRWFLNRREEWPSQQFHFNTNKLIDYLENVAQELGCRIFDDEITDVILGHDGGIQKIKGSKRDYNYDFYIDSTGFKRVLLNKLGAEWKSFSEYMHVNSAFTFQTPHEEEDNFPIWTLAKAMDSGWFFQIPTFDHMGNGYIYNSDFITEDEAKAEVEKLFGREIEIGKTFSFDPGYVENVWIKNCVAVGLSGSFVEPLEATSIGTSIQQAFLLCHRLPNYNDKSIELYNSSFASIMENIRDFIALHYITPRRDTEFWKSVAEKPLPPTLAERLEFWKDRLPILEDFRNDSDYTLFTDINYIQVMEGLDLFNVPMIKKEYQMQSKEAKAKADEVMEEKQRWLNSIAVVRHRDFIRLIRDLFA